MKRLPIILFTILFAISVSSCVVVVKKKHPLIGKKVTLGSFNGKRFVKNIKVFKHSYFRGARVIAILHPGDVVTLLRIEGPAAFIELPDGRRGWIRKVFIK